MEVKAGDTFGDWTALKESLIKKNERYWEVQCKCGLITVRRVSQLIHGRTKSCRTCSSTLREFILRGTHSTGLSPYWLTYLKHQAKRRNKEFTLIFEDLTSLWEEQQGRCYYTGIKLELSPHNRTKGKNTASLDRIDSSQGYIKGNIRWVHKNVNFMKQGFSHDEFVHWCDMISKRFDMPIYNHVN